jgi:hypothetical protein
MRDDEVIRRSRCEGEARGNLKRSLAALGTRIASLSRQGGIARNDKTTPNCLTFIPFAFEVIHRLP